MRIETFIGLRFLRSARQDRSLSIITWISMVGVMLGVTALVVTISVMNGFRANLFHAVTGTQPHARIAPAEGTIGPAARERLQEALAAHPAVEAVGPYFSRQVFLRVGDTYRAAILRGIDSAAEARVTRLSHFLRDAVSLPFLEGEPGGELLARIDRPRREGGPAGIILGSPLARALAVDTGDRVDVISPVKRMTPIGQVPLIKRFRVAAVFETGIGGTDDILAFVDLGLAQRLFRAGDVVDGLALRMADAEEIDAADLVARLPGGASGGWRVITWMDENRNVFQVMKLEKLGLFLILTLIIVVAFFNIISSLVMLVLEKTRGIAILKAVGATDAMVRRIFFMQGFWIGTVGTCTGVGLGLSACWALATFDLIRLPPGVYPVVTRLPVLVQWPDLTVIASASFLICLTVTLLPASRAARIRPVENLRFE